MWRFLTTLPRFSLPSSLYIFRLWSTGGVETSEFDRSATTPQLDRLGSQTGTRGFDGTGRLKTPLTTSLVLSHDTGEIEWEPPQDLMDISYLEALESIRLFCLDVTDNQPVREGSLAEALSKHPWDLLDFWTHGGGYVEAAAAARRTANGPGDLTDATPLIQGALDRLAERWENSQVDPLHDCLQEQLLALSPRRKGQQGRSSVVV